MDGIFGKDDKDRWQDHNEYKKDNTPNLRNACCIEVLLWQLHDFISKKVQNFCQGVHELQGPLKVAFALGEVGCGFNVSKNFYSTVGKFQVSISFINSLKLANLTSLKEV